MTIAWVNISTRWSITSIQAALNVFVSLLGTIGIWTLSRYWWQRGGSYVLRGKSDVPLSALFSLAGPGEGYDTVKVLGGKLFSKEHRRLLLQLLVVLLATLACMFAGPIAKISLRSAQTIHVQKLEVLQTTKGNIFIGNRLDANVEWNDTMQSLDNAGFPYNRLLDYLPPTTEPWTYAADEWNPTWSAACDCHEEVLLHDLQATGNATFHRPLEVFPSYRDTYDAAWLDSSKYRLQADSNFEQVCTEDNGIIIKDAMFWILLQSEPRVDDRMYNNDAPLQLSFSSLHAHNFGLSPNDTDITGSSLDQWRPFGPVEKASYTRLECNFTRNSGAVEQNLVPWLWTNDTWAITYAYRMYWMTEVGQRSSKNQTVTPPMLKYKQELEKLGVPDGRIDWMIHVAKLAVQNPKEEADFAQREQKDDQQQLKDRDYFGLASFGRSPDAGITTPQLARVYTSSRTSFSSASPSNDRRSRSTSRTTRSKSLSSQILPQIVMHPGKEPGKVSDTRNINGYVLNEHDMELSPTSADSSSFRVVDFTVSADYGATQSCTRDHSPHHDDDMLSPWTPSEGNSRASSRGGASCSRSSYQSIVPEEDEIEVVVPATDTFINTQCEKPAA
ncbi:hypothetical protein K458DRAFT_482927 [Lentithecium fluviatile CBS 122367]|uniref:Uncharacterized protein n=1 Tax=Lentithecium fluviatile CBS 122367 TaxID=1168545 RepID=A0A6G1JJR7_9PLEO|nr:hypothetical protein K458DRAFT_482927 [Lentithecium fluviatile CBS 122367]